MQDDLKQPIRRRIAPLTVVLSVVFVFFCGVLVYVYAATKHANPVMLDEHGHPIGQASPSPADRAH